MTVLVKNFDEVYVAGRPQLPYRPYSKTCPPPEPPDVPKRWQNKKVCGTRTVALVATTVGYSNGVVGYLIVETFTLPGVPVTVVTHPVVDGVGMAVGTFPYCAVVRVYE